MIKTVFALMLPLVASAVSFTPDSSGRDRAIEIREAIDNHCYAEYKAKKLAGVEGNYKDRFTE